MSTLLRKFPLKSNVQVFNLEVGIGKRSMVMDVQHFMQLQGKERKDKKTAMATAFECMNGSWLSAFISSKRQTL